MNDLRQMSRAIANGIKFELLSFPTEKVPKMFYSDPRMRIPRKDILIIVEVDTPTQQSYDIKQIFPQYFGP